MHRPPDYTTKLGLKIWFDELIYVNVEDIQRSMLVGADGKLYTQIKAGSRYLPFSKTVQDAYKEWKHKMAESFLL